MTHRPVLLQEVLDGLAVREGDVVLDVTVGDGGHAVEFCRRIGNGNGGIFLGMDADEEAARTAEKRLANAACRFIIKRGNFARLDVFLKEAGIVRVRKILFDLGLRSTLLEASGRGFSFRKDEPLLMTFDANPPAGAPSAAELVNSWSEADLARIFKTYGEERFAGRIARRIVEARKKRRILTTRELADIIDEAVPRRGRSPKLHFAARTFQALRIAVNDELRALQSGLEKGCDALAVGGRIAVVSFHSLEDRIVKHFFKEKSKSERFELLTKKPIVPGARELKENPRARSAKLRILQKI